MYHYNIYMYHNYYCSLGIVLVLKTASMLGCFRQSKRAVDSLLINNGTVLNLNSGSVSSDDI